MLMIVCYLTLRGYNSLVDGESHGIFLLFNNNDYILYMHLSYVHSGESLSGKIQRK